MCVPNRVEQLTAFPLKPEECGFIYYVKRGTHGQRRLKVRPAKVLDLYNYMREHNRNYAKHATWLDKRADDVFGAGWGADDAPSQVASSSQCMCMRSRRSMHMHMHVDMTCMCITCMCR